MIARRDFIKRMAAVGAGAAVPAAMLSACGGGDDPPAHGRRETHHLHFDLSAAPITQARLFAPRSGSHRKLLAVHDDASRQRHRALDPALQRVCDARLTHYLEDVDLPDTALQGLQVTGRHPVHDTPLLAAAAIHVPTASRRAKTARAVPAATPADSLPDQIDDYLQPKDVAAYLVFHHPEVMNLNPDLGAVILERIHTQPCAGGAANCVPAIGTLVFKIAMLTAAGGYPSTTPGGWATLVAIDDGDGNPVLDENGEPVYRFDLADEIAAAVGEVVRQVLPSLFDDAQFEGGNWHATTGASVVRADAHRAGSKRAADDAATMSVVSSHPMGSTISGIGLVNLAVTDAQARQLTLTVKNQYVRYLSVFASYFDALGHPVALIDPTHADTADAKYLTLVAPNTQIMGIPLTGADVTSTDIAFLVPENASSVMLKFGSLGLGGNAFCPEALMGSALTLAINIALPTMMLALGIYNEAQAGLEGLLGDQSLLQAIGGAIVQSILDAGTGFANGIYGTVSSASIEPFLASAGNAALQVLLKTAPKIGLYITALVTAEAPIATLLPAVAVAIRVFATLAALAAIATSVGEVLASPAVTTITVSLTMDTTLSLARDPRDFQFPASARRWEALAYYDGGKVPRAVDGAITQGRVDPIAIVFSGVPSGGKVRFLVSLYADDGCLVGLAQSDTIDNLPATATQVSLTLTESLAALNANTQYVHSLKLAYAAGAHAWTATSAPTQTLADLCAGTDGPVCSLTGLTVHTASGMAGYGFGANMPLCDGSGDGIGYTARNIFLGSDPESSIKSLGCGMTQPVGVLYDPIGPASDGRHFFLEPSTYRPDPSDLTTPPVGVFLLRAVTLDTQTPWAAGGASSWGCFSTAVDSLTVLPTGYVVGVNRTSHKMQVLLLPEEATDLDAAPQSTTFAAQKCGQGRREGLLDTPVAVASLGNAVLVLEQGNRRVQALDAHANAVPLFSGGTSNVMALRAEEGITYLDLAVEGQGYMYVLSYQGDGTLPAQYRLDLYTPDGAFQARTVGVAAACIAVDLFRNLYTLNYETLAGAPTSEPSLSQWLPHTPGACPAPPPASAAPSSARGVCGGEPLGVRT